MKKLKVAILDDEYIVLEGLRSLVDWDKYNAEVVITANDGITGLNLIMEHKPDVVFTDIRMPGMSGLSVIEKVKYILPDTVFVIISGYSDFEYAKKAIALGVLDYIEKPVTLDNANDAMEKAALTIRDMLEIKEMKETKTGGNGDRILSFLKGDFSAIPVKLTGGEYVRAVGFAVCICQLCRWDEDIDSVSASVKNIITRYNDGDVLCEFIVRNSQFILIFALINRSDFEIYDILLKSKMDCIQRGINFCAGIGGMYPTPGELPASYSEAREALKLSIFSESYQIISYERIEASIKQYSLILEIETPLLSSLRALNKDEVSTQIDGFMRKCRDMGLSRAGFYDISLELVYIAVKAVKQMGLDYIEDELSTYEIYSMIEQFENFTELLNWVQNKFSNIIKYIESVKGQGIRREIIKAKEYLDNNYRKDITLFELSEYVHMNPTYFSVVFKKEIGLSYVKYLTKIRMDNAVTLLKRGYKVYEISEMIGYHSYNYFCEIFKKHFGVTAQQFKENL